MSDSIEKILIQIIKLENSVRSEAISIEINNSEEILRYLKKIDDESTENIGILVVAEWFSSRGFRVSIAPIMSIGQFINTLENKRKISNG